MFNQTTGTWVDYLPVILLITSSVGALLPTGILLWLVRDVQTAKKDLGRVETKTEINSENISDLEVKVQKVHDRNHQISNSLHALQLDIAKNSD